MDNPFLDSPQAPPQVPAKTPVKADAPEPAAPPVTRRDGAHPVASGGGDQAGRLRNLVAPKSPTAKSSHTPTVAILGAKGGVGTTTITWRLAEALAAADRSPLAVDAHLWQPDLARVAGHALGNDASLPDVLAGTTPAADAVRISDGPALLPGSWATTPNANQQDLGTQLATTVADELSSRFDTVLIDGGPARTPWTGSLCAAADLVLIVTTPGELALLGAYALIKLATTGSQQSPPIRLLVNRCENEAHGRATHARIRDACRQHLDATVTLAGWLPPDPRLANRDEPPIPLMRPIARRVREALGKRKTTAATQAA